MKRLLPASKLNPIKQGKFLSKLAALSTSSNSATGTPVPTESYSFSLTDECDVRASCSTPIQSEIDEQEITLSFVENSEKKNSNFFGTDIDLNENVTDTDSSLITSDDESDQDLVLSNDSQKCSSEISVTDFSCLMVAYQRKHKATDAAMDDICKIFNGVLKPGPEYPTSFKVINRILSKLIEKEYGHLNSEVVKLCGTCYQVLEQKSENHCITAGRQKKPFRYFTCNIEKQMQTICRNYGPELLTFLRQASEISASDNRVTDLVTGEFYKSMFPNPNGSTLQLNLLVNADGAKFTKSKFGSFWPVDALVAELPPKLRTKFENCVLLAFWQGEEKPLWERVLKPAIEELRTLGMLGFPCEINEKIYHVKVKILATVFDLPARAHIWKVTQYNGK